MELLGLRRVVVLTAGLAEPFGPSQFYPSACGVPFLVLTSAVLPRGTLQDPGAVLVSHVKTW